MTTVARIAEMLSRLDRMCASFRGRDGRDAGAAVVIRWHNPESGWQEAAILEVDGRTSVEKIPAMCPRWVERALAEARVLVR